MNVKDIQELFDLQQVLADVTGSVDADIVTAPNVLAALLDWKHADDGKVDIETAKAATTKRGKAKTPEPEPKSFEPSPDPSESDF